MGFCAWYRIPNLRQQHRAAPLARESDLVRIDDQLALSVSMMVAPRYAIVGADLNCLSHQPE
jgi:hypothetical protein